MINVGILSLNKMVGYLDSLVRYYNLNTGNYKFEFQEHFYMFLNNDICV